MPPRKDVFESQQIGPLTNHEARSRDNADAAIPERPGDQFRPEPILLPAVPGMLMDTDGDEAVEASALAGDVAMVAFEEPNLSLQPVPSEALAHVVVLAPYRIIDGHIGAVSLRHIDRHVAPAGADLEHLHPGLQAKLTADFFVVVEFRLAERLRFVGPQALGIADSVPQNVLEQRRRQRIVEVGIANRPGAIAAVVPPFLRQLPDCVQRISQHVGPELARHDSRVATQSGEGRDRLLAFQIDVTVYEALEQAFVEEEERVPLRARRSKPDENVAPFRARIALDRRSRRRIRHEGQCPVGPRRCAQRSSGGQNGRSLTLPRKPTRCSPVIERIYDPRRKHFHPGESLTRRCSLFVESLEIAQSK